jgi:hypothetical protein
LNAGCLLLAEADYQVQNGALPLLHALHRPVVLVAARIVSKARLMSLRHITYHHAQQDAVFAATATDAASSRDGFVLGGAIF